MHPTAVSCCLEWVTQAADLFADDDAVRQFCGVLAAHMFLNPRSNKRSRQGSDTREIRHMPSLALASRRAANEKVRMQFLSLIHI